MQRYTRNYPPRPPFTLTKRRLRRKLRGQPPCIKGSAGAQLVRGEMPYQLSPADAAAIVGTHARFVHAALGHVPKQLTDAQVDHLVERIGANRLMAALDRWSQPSLSLQAAE